MIQASTKVVEGDSLKVSFRVERSLSDPLVLGPKVRYNFINVTIMHRIMFYLSGIDFSRFFRSGGIDDEGNTTDSKSIL